MKGHIRLGTTVADLREYMLTDPNALSKQLANQMAAKLGQGAGKYDDLQDWSAWVMDNWSAGAGTVDTDGGGFLFGTVDSRVPRQLLLPPAQGVITSIANTIQHNSLPAFWDDTISPGTFTSVAAASTATTWLIDASWTKTDPNNLWLYAKIPLGATITVQLYQFGGAGTLYNTDTYTAEVSEKCHAWHSIPITYSFTTGTTYRLRVSCNVDWEIFINDDTGNPIYIFQDNTADVVYLKTIRFNDQLYALHPGGLGKFDSVNNNWDAVAGAPASGLRDMVVFNGKLYIGRDNAIGNLYTMSTAEAFTLGAVVGEYFYKWNGYLYRVNGDSFYYTADGTTWTGPFLSEPGEDIFAMAGMGNDIYFANRNGLYRFAPGDTVFGIAQWGKYAYSIGKISTGAAGYITNALMPGMVAFQGDIYVAVDGQIIRYTANGQMSEIWLKDSGDLPAAYVGRISSLGTMNNYLIATVVSDDGNQDSVWAWNKQGWHNLAMLPDSYPYGAYSTYYDRTLGRLWIMGYHHTTFLTISDYAQNPYSITASKYMPEGWLETYWFDGNLIEIRKDFESVYVTGDSISVGQSILLYWMDDASTDWELLGTVDSDREEINWSDAATRPNSRQIKLAMSLRTNDIELTPKLEAIRIKYMSMLLDRYRWSMAIALSANQEMLDKTLNSYTVAQQEAHVESLIESVAPIFFEDINGVQYKVKVLGASRSIRDFEYRNPSTAKVYKLVYNIVIEQTLSNINV